MSRIAQEFGAVDQRFPRVSGDEPTVTLTRRPIPGFSPRERG